MFFRKQLNNGIMNKICWVNYDDIFLKIIIHCKIMVWRNTWNRFCKADCNYCVSFGVLNIGHKIGRN